MSTKAVLISAALLMAIWVLSFPVRDLAADYHYRRVTNILDDPATEDIDVLSISEKSLPAYLAAIDSLQKSAAMAPSRALYQSAMAELYTRLWKWSAVMTAMNAPLPHLAVLPRDASEKALIHLLRAASIEPTNPDVHLALGVLFNSALGDPDQAGLELKKAEAAFPENAPLRYALARHYLLSGRNADALDQARVLAKIDVSHILAESAEKADMLVLQPPEYVRFVQRSFLYAALEIAWSVSGSIDTIQGLAPDTPDTGPVVRLFVDAVTEIERRRN